MSELKVAIIDDEPLARERLRRFVQNEEDARVVAECHNGDEAVDALRREKVDVALLDVQMPGRNGFEVLAELGSFVPRAVIFTTAFDQFALRAFDFHAVDYLLKPFDKARFHTAWERARERIASHSPDQMSQKLSALLADLRQTASSPKPIERIPVKNAGKVTFVNIADIDWVGSADNYVEMHVGTVSHLLRETLTAMTSRLPQEQFVRISRTAIVNISRVKELQPLFYGEYSVLLRDGTKLTLSRSHRDQLAKLGLN